MQSNHSGQLGSCSQPQPHAFENMVVFAPHVKSITVHCEGVPTYLRACVSLVGSQVHVRWVHDETPAAHEQVLQPSPALKSEPSGCAVPA